MGCSAHADDVRAASLIGLSSAQTQGDLINELNSLKLNSNKTEVMVLIKGKLREGLLNGE